MASSDPDVIKIHLQSSLSEFNPNENFFSLPLENGEQITEKGNRVQCTNFTLEILNQNVDGLITYAIDKQIFKFKAIIGHKDPPKTINLHEQNNLQLLI